MNDFQQRNSKVQFALNFSFPGHYMKSGLELGKNGIQKPYLEVFSMIQIKEATQSRGGSGNEREVDRFKIYSRDGISRTW